jgi:hypothetical protein
VVRAAREAVYAAGVILDTFDPAAPAPSMQALAEACDMLGVRRPVALQEALAAEDRG